MADGQVLHGSGHALWSRNLRDGTTRRLQLDGEAHSARLSPDGDAAVIALEDRIVVVNLSTFAWRTIFERLDIPAAFDARYRRVRFNDAALLPTGTLVFDALAIGNLDGERQAVSSRSVWVGGSHAGCETEEAPAPSHTLPRDPIRRLSALAPSVRPRRRAW
jgi:sugar lactone lactonase YvrE